MLVGDFVKLRELTAGGPGSGPHPGFLSGLIYRHLANKADKASKYAFKLSSQCPMRYGHKMTGAAHEEAQHRHEAAAAAAPTESLRQMHLRNAAIHSDQAAEHLQDEWGLAAEGRKRG